MDVEFCDQTLPDWELQCWGVPSHKGHHHGGNFQTRRMGLWGPGVPTHVQWMPKRD